MLISMIGLAKRAARVGLIGSGRFWCLYCEGEHGYQLRQWGQVRFVRCDACQATFHPECLDESSTKTCDELVVAVPESAWAPARVPRWEQSLSEYLGWEQEPPEVTSE